MLEPPSSHHLRAAEGWLELGDYAEALAELDQIEAHLLERPEVLDMRCRIGTASKQWQLVIDASAKLIDQHPDDPEWHIRHGNALYFAGRTGEARAFVLPLVSRFPENSILMYNLACYECQLGHFEDSKAWLAQALAMNKALRQFSRQDPDLAPFWQHYPEL